MTTAATSPAATMVDGPRVRVYQPHEFEQLVDAALADDPGAPGGVQRLIYEEDLEAVRRAGTSPSTVLVVTIAGRYGAAYFRCGQEAWITDNGGRADHGAPDLVFDDQAPSLFPRSAVIATTALRPIISTYVAGGGRTSSVPWTPATQYLPW